MNRISDFIDFNAEELAAVESFQAYIFRHNDEDIAFWEDFIAKHPERLPEITEASRLLNALKFKPSRVARQTRQAELNRLIAALPEETTDQDLMETEGRLSLYQSIAKHLPSLKAGRMVVAALSVIAIVFFAGFHILRSLAAPEVVTYRTNYGETASYLLPDSTIVVLNGNSSLVREKDWDDEQVREVWLEGEGFFEVKHKGVSPESRFVVHTSGIDVEVLGTRFNVFNRNDRVNVVLNSGKVKVRIAALQDTGSVVMMPDEALEFSRKDLTVKKSHVKAEALTSWRNQILVFENTPLSRIGEMIQDTYGLKVVFSDNVDYSQELAGTVPCENLDVLLDVLAKSSNLHITKQEHQIVIAKQETKSTDQ
jgi:transmembrane sensor